MKALITAIEKGYHAKEQFISRDDCPYPDHRTTKGRVTYSRASRKAWFEGWDMAHHNRAMGDYDGWYIERATR